jgi:hypothetical protein
MIVIALEQIEAWIEIRIWDFKIIYSKWTFTYGLHVYYI